MRIIGSIDLSVGAGESPRRGNIGYRSDGQAVHLCCLDRGAWMECGVSATVGAVETADAVACRLAGDIYRDQVWAWRDGDA